MSNDTEKEAGETGRKVSRRRLLGQAALVVGGAAAAAGMTARSALARASDVSIDSSGKVSIHGTTPAAQDKTMLAAEDKKSSGGTKPRTRTYNRCNHKCTVAPQ